MVLGICEENEKVVTIPVLPNLYVRPNFWQALLPAKQDYLIIPICPNSLKTNGSADPGISSNMPGSALPL